MAKWKRECRECGSKDIEYENISYESDEGSTVSCRLISCNECGAEYESSVGRGRRINLEPRTLLTEIFKEGRYRMYGVDGE
jgi:RNase P subunit RPR2